MCVEIYDLASVSLIMRSISNSVRWRHPPVSANVRRKPLLIARRPHFDCASLHLVGEKMFRRLADDHERCPQARMRVFLVLGRVQQFERSSLHGLPMCPRLGFWVEISNRLFIKAAVASSSTSQCPHKRTRSRIKERSGQAG